MTATWLAKLIKKPTIIFNATFDLQSTFIEMNVSYFLLILLHIHRKICYYRSYSQPPQTENYQILSFVKAEHMLILSTKSPCTRQITTLFFALSSLLFRTSFSNILEYETYSLTTDQQRCCKVNSQEKNPTLKLYIFKMTS